LVPITEADRVVAWEASFSAPRGKVRYSLALTGFWPHEDCDFPSGAPPPDQYAEWGFRVKLRR
ncbi:MAG TPA: hypothetical protein VHF58_09115, partial [Solirubrobacterales bacterium]|nr:hypothetical protein [Solirubrobacterales bacterium]